MISFPQSLPLWKHTPQGIIYPGNDSQQNLLSPLPVDAIARDSDLPEIVRGCLKQACLVFSQKQRIAPVRGHNLLSEDDGSVKKLSLEGSHWTISGLWLGHKLASSLKVLNLELVEDSPLIDGRVQFMTEGDSLKQVLEISHFVEGEKTGTTATLTYTTAEISLAFGLRLTLEGHVLIAAFSVEVPQGVAFSVFSKLEHPNIDSFATNLLSQILGENPNRRTGGSRRAITYGTITGHEEGGWIAGYKTDKPTSLIVKFDNLQVKPDDHNELPRSIEQLRLKALELIPGLA